ncbi:hypothetical protein [Streptomyces swartbergensis]|uniref:hypothetical protein n=1 Tax=Streptomyces swartbergensis TaxID=487165 RepID=UPI0038098E6C
MTAHQIVLITALITAIATLLQAVATLINAMRKDQGAAPQTGGADSVREREQPAGGDE